MWKIILNILRDFSQKFFIRTSKKNVFSHENHIFFLTLNVSLGHKICSYVCLYGGVLLSFRAFSAETYTRKHSATDNCYHKLCALHLFQYNMYFTPFEKCHASQVTGH